MSYGPDITNPKRLVTLTKREIEMEFVRNQANAVNDSVPAGSEGGYPANGINCEGRCGKSFKIASDQALTVYIQGRDDPSDAWATLTKLETDAVMSWTLAAAATIWLNSNYPANYVRLWLKNSGGSAANVQIRFNGGR